jgi:uncharacterized membrane protein YcaP (DUF421 family)
MASWFALDWERLFVPSQPVLETVLRGTVTYVCLFALLRIFRRQTGSIGPADLLVLLLIADASQNAMAGEYRAITDGLILVATIIGWEYLLDLVGYHVPSFGRILERPPLKVVEDGKIISASLEQELMTVDELLSQLRRCGVDDVRVVRASYIEGDGHVSVITERRPASEAPTERSSASRV